MTPRPHDALFKAAFEDPASAAALLRALVPAAVRDAVAWDTLQGEPGGFVDAALRDRHSDLLFSVRLRSGAPALLYLLLEHQSTSDPAMPLRMVAYQLRIWDRFRKADPSAWLPPIIAVLVSHVAGGWTAARAFEAMFDPAVLAIPGLAALVPRCAMIVEDLADVSDHDLQSRALAAFPKVALWLLRDARDPVRLLDRFASWIAAISAVARAPEGLAAFTALISYLFRVLEPVHREALRAKLGQLEPHAQEVAMSIADQLHEEGRNLGLSEGRVAALRHLLAVKFAGQALGADHEARLAAATSDALDRYLERVLGAGSLAAVFDD
jgi:hypothetical protein